MTAEVTTRRILAEKALQETCGQQCVDWAIGLLERGSDSHYIFRLAGMVPPHNHFEIAELRDNVLSDLAIEDTSPEKSITAYTLEICRSVLNGEGDVVAALTEIAQLCISAEYQRNIMDFYLLYFAYTDLQSSDVQWYWDGLTTENALTIIRERMATFVEENPG